MFFVTPADKETKKLKISKIILLRKQQKCNTSKITSSESVRSNCLIILNLFSLIYTVDDWNVFIKENSTKYFDQEKMITSLKIGINDSLRGRIWILLSGGLNLAVNHSENFYYKLVESADTAAEEMIKADIDRTIITKFDYKKEKVEQIDINSKKTKLFNVLKAYAVYDPEVSYVQGTNYIVALFLNNMNSERASFWTFVKFMSLWRETYTKDTPRLLKMLNDLIKMFQEKLPQIYEYFEKIDFLQYFTAVFSQYFLTIFSYNCPIDYANRVMDFFWVNEEKIIFDCILHIFDMQKFAVIQMDAYKLVGYIRNDIVIDCINSWGLQGALPFGVDVI